MSIRNEKAMKAAAGVGEKSGLVSLNVMQRCDEASEFELELFRRIVAQDEAALALSQIYQVYLAKLIRLACFCGSKHEESPTLSDGQGAVYALPHTRT